MLVAGERVTLQPGNGPIALAQVRRRLDANAGTLSWLAGHNGCFQRMGGIPAVVRVDSTKTAVVRGAGAWGQLNDSYRRYANTVPFHTDPCAPPARSTRARWNGPCTHRRLNLEARQWGWT